MPKPIYNSTYRQELHHKILKTAMADFREKGVKAVKMDDVANQLSISKRTLYEIYHTKEDLLFACVRNYHEEFEKKLAQEIGLDNNVMDVLISFMKLHIENSGTTNPLFYSEVQKYPKVKKYIANRNQENRSKSIAFLTRGVNEGYFRSDVNYEIINLMTEVFMKHVMDTELYRTYPLTTIFKDFFVTILRGVCTQQGIALIDNFKIRG